MNMDLIKKLSSGQLCRVIMLKEKIESLEDESDNTLKNDAEN
jgi:hypothetical protein